MSSYYEVHTITIQVLVIIPTGVNYHPNGVVSTLLQHPVECKICTSLWAPEKVLQEYSISNNVLCAVANANNGV